MLKGSHPFFHILLEGSDQCRSSPKRLDCFGNLCVEVGLRPIEVFKKAGNSLNLMALPPLQPPQPPLPTDGPRTFLACLVTYLAR